MRLQHPDRPFGPPATYTAIEESCPDCPGRLYGLDVTLHVGERHLGGGSSHNPNARDLGARGVPTNQRTMDGASGTSWR